MMIEHICAEPDIYRIEVINDSAGASGNNKTGEV